MSNCIVCDKDTDQYNILINICSLYPDRGGINAITLVCPECGTMKLLGADEDHMKFLATGYPEPTPEIISAIDIDYVLDNLVLPNILNDEKKVWIDSSSNNTYEVIFMAVAEQAYQHTFGNGYPYTDPIYNRLIHFLSMDNTERDLKYGPIQCPAVEFFDNGGYKFLDGHHRFLLLRFLGATRIPVCMTQESIDIAESSGIPIYLSKTG